MSEFKATVSFIHGVLIPELHGEREIKKEIQNSSTNNRHLEVIRQFDNGNCHVSSADEIVKVDPQGRKHYSFKVDFNTGDNLDIQEVIERFSAVFVFKGISEVTKN